MKSAASSVRNDEFDIRDAARREARRNGVSLGQWLDGVMTERASALGLRLVDLDPQQRIAAIVTRLNDGADPATVPQPHAGLDSYGGEAAAHSGPLGDRDPGTPLEDKPQEQVMTTETAAQLPAQDEAVAVPLTLTNPVAPHLDAFPVETPAAVGAARRQAAQRVEIETKLNALFAALDRTPRRSNAGDSASELDDAEPVRRRRALMGETAIIPSWRLEKAVSEIADRQAFLERQSADAGLSGGGSAKPGPRAAALQARIAADIQRRPAPEPVPSIFTSLQSDLARIAKRLDAVHLDVTRRPATASEPTVQDMRTLLGEMRPDASIDTLGRQVEALSSKLDTVIEQRLPREALSQLSQRIEDVHAELAARLADHAAVAPVIDMAAVEQLINAALDQAARSAPAVPDLHPLESAVQDLADKLDRAERAQGDSTAFADLQAQVGTLAARIDRSDVGLTAIVALERSLGEMFTQLGSLKEASLEAAESTARAAAEETLQAALARPDFAAHLSGLGEAALSQMSQDVAQMRADRDDADSRLHAILAALNTSLERVVDRLGALEEEATETRRMPAVAPSAPAPAVEAPRLASPAEPAWSDPLEQAVALGVAEHPEDVASDPAEPLDLTAPLQTEGWDTPAFGSRQRPSVFDELGQPPGKAPDPTSFIAAARRAAQAAVQEQAQTLRPDGTEAPAQGVGTTAALRSRFKAGMLSKRRPLLLAAAGLVLLIGIAQVVRIGLSGNDTTGSIPASDVTATTPAPIVSSPPPGPKADAEDDGAPATPVETAAANPPPSQTPPAPEKTASPPPAGPQAAPGIIVSSDPIPARAPLPTMAMGPGASIAALQAAETSSRVAAAELAPALRTQAESGVPAAQFEAGLRYADGRGVARDLPTAARWFEKAAQQGLAPAAYRLGSLYEKGLGVARDPAKAIEWYRKAADAGNIRAMHNLAVLLAEGATGKSDYPGAATWFTKAAQAGVRDSQFNLAILYARGLGIAQNLSQSYTWFAIAAAQGDQDSVKKRDEVAGHLDAATLAQAKATVAAFTPEPSVSAANDVPVPAGGWDAAPSGKVPASAHFSRS